MFCERVFAGRSVQSSMAENCLVCCMLVIFLVRKGIKLSGMYLLSVIFLLV